LLGLALRPRSVKVRRTLHEHLSSALLSNPDIARYSRHFAFVPCMAQFISIAEVAMFPSDLEPLTRINAMWCWLSDVQ
jgi:hypothetical protein